MREDYSVDSGTHEDLPYQLIHARIQIEDKEMVTWLCRSKDYKRPDESKIALDTFYQMERLVSESPLDFCIRQGWAEYVYQMLVIDFLILNETVINPPAGAGETNRCQRRCLE